MSLSLFSDAEIAGMSGGVRPPAPKNYKLPTQYPSFSIEKRISIDLESVDSSLGRREGPGWRKDASIVGFSLAIEGHDGQIWFKEYYPLRHLDAPNLDADRVLGWLSTELAFFTGEIVGTNLLYDFDGFQYQSIFAPMAKYRDVQWAEALIDENAMTYRLDALATKYLGQGKAKEELKRLYGNSVIERFDEIHPGHARTYGLGDVELPLQVLRMQEAKLKEQNLTALFDIESRLLPMLLYMRRKGQRIDVAAADKLREVFTQKRNDALHEASKQVPIRGFELNVENFGKPSLIKAAFDALNIQYPKTALGNASFPDKWMESLDHPFGTYLATANKFDKALETFVEGYLTKYAIGDHIHAEFHPLRKVDDESGKRNGTVSGRFSSVHPNLQNIPTRDDAIGPLLRAVFLPEKDCDFFSGDYSQIEFRLLVHAAVVRAKLKQADKRWGSPDRRSEILQSLQAALKAQQMYKTDPKTDFHNMVVALTGLARKYAKNINFGIAFTMGVWKLAQQLGLLEADPANPEKMKPSQKALDIMKQYHDNVPFVKAIGQAMTHEAQEDGFITTLLGRRTHYTKWEAREFGEPRTGSLPLAEAMVAFGKDDCPRCRQHDSEKPCTKHMQRADTHTALNRFTQGSGADGMKIAMVNAWESGILDSDDLIISLTVHDELDGSVARNKAAQEKLRELQHIMDTAITLEVPVFTQFSIGNNWSETH